MIEILTRCIQFPNSTTLLEEINLPPKVVRSVIGTTVTVEILPEEKAMSRRVDVKNIGPDDWPFLIDDDGACWVDYRPVRVRFADQDGRVGVFHGVGPIESPMAHPICACRFRTTLSLQRH